MKRKVSDILTVGRAPLSFIQLNRGKYEAVCPWCTKDLGKVNAKTYGDLIVKMFPIQSKHMNMCKQREALEGDIKVFI